MDARRSPSDGSGRSFGRRWAGRPTGPGLSALSRGAARVAGLLALLGAFASPVRAVPLDDDSPVSSALAAVYRAWQGSVVQVIAYRMTGPLVSASPDGMTALEPPRGTLWATGVVLDDAGHVLTCAETAQPGDSLEIRLPDGTRTGAVFLAQDVTLGLSLVRARRTAGLVAARRSIIGDPRSGEWLFVVSFPAGARQPDLRLGCLAGPLPAPGREGPHFRLDLADCHGACGGAVVDARGRFRGMLVDLRADREEDLAAGRAPGALDPLECEWVRAISEAEVLRSFQRLIDRSRAPAGFLGVRAEPVGSTGGVPAGSALPAAALEVVWVLPGSPAEAAGIRAGDQILAINGQPVRDTDEITRVVAGSVPGTWVRVRLSRAGAPVDVEARLIDRSALDWQEREEQLNLSRQKRVRTSIDQLQRRLKSLEQARARLQ